MYLPLFGMSTGTVGLHSPRVIAVPVPAAPTNSTGNLVTCVPLLSSLVSLGFPLFSQHVSCFSHWHLLNVSAVTVLVYMHI